MVSSLGSSLKSSASLGKRAVATTSSSQELGTIASLEAKLTSPKYNPNPLLDLLTRTRSSSPEVVHKAIWSLYRVFAKFIADGRLQRVSSRKSAEADEAVEGGSPAADTANQVVQWVEQRFQEYVDSLSGLLRDCEPSLRASSIKILLNLLQPLSASISSSSGSSVIAIPHLRRLLDALLFPVPSLRGAKSVKSKGGSSWKSLADNQYTPVGEDAVDGELPRDVLDVVVKHLVDYDDLRWAFFREVSSIIESYTTKSQPIPPTLAATTLALLLPLNNLPQKPDDINEFFIAELATRPAGLSKSKKAKTSVVEDGEKKKKGKAPAGNVTPDWMAYYESSEDESDDEDLVNKKRKRGDKKAEVKTGGGKRGMHVQIWTVESHRKGFTSAWLGLLSLPLNEAQIRSILLVLHSTIFPNLVRGRVVRITDWLGSICDRGGPLALLSLNGLFMLIMQYNLEYPQFYRRLYALMDRNVMHVKYRARFFRLTATFLASPLLPAAIVASFIKRLSQLALNSPPASIIMIIPFIYNLLKHHPSCMIMLQREDAEFKPANPSPFAINQAPSKNYEDPFDADEKDPLKTKALDSCLWELKSLQRHYLSHVATMAKIFNEVFTKPEFVMEDFLDHGYTSLFETEINRKVKHAPALNIDEVIAPFPLQHTTTPGKGDGADEDAEVIPGDAVNDMWSFGVNVSA